MQDMQQWIHTLLTTIDYWAVTVMHYTGLEYHHSIGFMLLGVMVSLFSLPTILFHLMRLVAPYPKTRFGFRGKLIYSDEGKRSWLFRNTTFGINAKPDLIYRLQNGSYVIIELKSRVSRILASDRVQTLVSVVAVRSRYPVKKAAVLIGSGKLEWLPDASKGSDRLVKQNMAYIKQARAIKYRGAKTSPEKCEHCFKCQYKSHCWGHR